MHPDPLNAPAPPEALDPVCGRTVATADAPKLLYRGHRFYFCSHACRLAFKRAPERHADAHPEAAVAIPPLVPPRTRPASPFQVARGELPPEPRPADEAGRAAEDGRGDDRGRD